MANKIYFTSDLHFGHKNLCEELRGMTAEESDRLIVSNWNDTVDKHDKVFILGDLTMSKHKLIPEMLTKLNGVKQVILGNHDDPKTVKELVNLGIKVSATAEYNGYLLTHMPCHPNELKFYKGNIHGHIHNQGLINIDGKEFHYSETNPEGKYFNVNVEFHNYFPVSFFDIERHFQNLL